MDKKLRRAVIAGNWKMNKNRKEAGEMIAQLEPMVKNADCDVVLCVPFTDLETAVSCCAESNIQVGAQNCHFESAGAFTGEISADMLKEMQVSYVVIGHSERRQYFAETNQTVNQRLKAALHAGLTGILCVGETLEDRQSGVTDQLVALQTKMALQGVTAQQMQKVIIAYEPVWAIGTGETATSEQAQEVCALIRSTVADLYGQEIANGLTVQYGGSMNPKNAAELLGKTDVDGGLIGGASLKANDFAEIVAAASRG